MSLFLPNIPQSSDNLDSSQSQLLSNNSGLDTVFGIDHYKFSDSTADKGFHNKVTTPVVIVPPPNAGQPAQTGANPVFYAFQDSANVGVIQYSRGPNNAVPSPITYLQSPLAAQTIALSGTLNILDCTGLPKAMFKLHAVNLSVVTASAVEALIGWDGTTLSPIRNIVSTSFTAQAAGATIQILNNGANATEVRWSLQMLRLQ